MILKEMLADQKTNQDQKLILHQRQLRETFPYSSFTLERLSRGYRIKFV